MPTEFTCPPCGNTTEVADQHVGLSVPCATCGKEVSLVPEEKTRLIGCWRVALTTLAIVFVGAVIIVVPAVRSAREEARRDGCCWRPKQMGLALQNYKAVHGSFPPAHTVDENGNRLHSWRTLVLPYMEEEEKALYDQFNLEEPWNSPTNLQVLADNPIPDRYRCNVATGPPNETSLVMVVGSNTMAPGERGRKLSELTDDPSRTIMVVEITDSGITWTEPRDLSVDRMSFGVNDGKRGISSLHVGGAWVLMADGSVEFLDESTAPEVIREMITITPVEPMTGH